MIDVEKLLDDLGIEVTVLKEGHFKAIGSPFKELTLEEFYEHSTELKKKTENIEV